MPLKAVALNATAVPGRAPYAIFDLLAPRPDWQRYGLCHGKGCDPWFPKSRRSIAPGAAVCARCPVAQECLEYALSLEDNPDGIWAGTTPDDRRRLKRESA